MNAYLTWLADMIGGRADRRTWRSRVAPAMIAAVAGLSTCGLLAPPAAVADQPLAGPFGPPVASSAVASTVGGLPGAGALTDGLPTGGGTWLQLASANGQYTVPSDGVITSWSFAAQATPPTGLTFVVVRGGPAPDAALDNVGQYTIVASSPAGSVQPSQVNTYPVQIPVKAGDVIGMFTSTAAYAYVSGTRGISDIPYPSAGPGVNAGGSPVPYAKEFSQLLAETGLNSATYPGFRLPISAQVEPDADGDGFGDLSQDRCPGVFGSVQGCPAADLAISQSVPGTTTGTTVTYQITATNNGPDPVPDVTVTDSLPAGATLVSAVPSNGTCTSAAPLTCTVGPLANGASATVAVTVTPGGPGTDTNTATVASADLVMAAQNASGAGDPNPANDTAAATTTVPAVAPVGGTGGTGGTGGMGGTGVGTGNGGAGGTGGTGGTGGNSTTAGMTTTRPTTRLTAVVSLKSRSVAVTGNRTAMITLQCQAGHPGCVGKLTLTAASRTGRKPIVLATATFNLKAGSHKTLKIRLAQITTQLLNQHRGSLPGTAALQLKGAERAVAAALTLRR